MMNTQQLIEQLNTHPEQVQFSQVIETISSDYQYTPSRFTNGKGESQVINEAGSNEGSCKIFAFAKLQNLSVAQTLQCFGDYYRKDVLEHPEATDHANIRQFMIHGWDGIQFEQQALTAR